MKLNVWLCLQGAALAACGGAAPQPGPLVDKYAAVTLIDVHNHDAARHAYRDTLEVWRAYSVDRVVLFGDISEPSAVETDDIAWKAYTENRGFFVPFFAGFDIHDPSSVQTVTRRLDQGFVGVGEFVAASSLSPVTSNLPWKGVHPMDGYFPEIYAICARYDAPILLHIDPPAGVPIDRLEEALTRFPNTHIVFGHANAFNAPANIEALLAAHPNLYIDFFAGFTRYNSGSTNSLADFVPVIRRYPERFMVSSDSGYGVGYDHAYNALYELFDLLEPAVVEQIAHRTFETLVARRTVLAEASSAADR